MSIEGATIGKLSDSVRIQRKDFGRRLELDQAPEGVTCDLSEEGGLSFGYDCCIIHGTSFIWLFSNKISNC